MRSFRTLFRAIFAVHSSRRRSLLKGRVAPPEQLETRALLAAFTAGNLVVSRVGDGSTTLGSAATNVAIQEFATTGGSAVQTISLPGSGADQVTDSGSATSNGYINTRLGNLGIPGYNSATGTGSVAGSNTKVGTVYGSDGNRASRNVFPTGGPAATPPSPFSGNNFRSMIPTSSSTFYASGTSSGTPSTGGVWYYDGSNFTQVSSTATGQLTNIRNVEIYGGQLYVSSSSGTFVGISSVGTGLPVTTGQSATLQINLGTGSPYGFVMFDTDNDGTLDRAYIADDRNVAGAGLQKWTLSSGTWSNSWSLLVNASNSLSATAGTGYAGLRGLTGTFINGTATLFATTTETSNNRLISISDTGSTTPTTASSIATAGTNYVFRGVDLAPDSAAPTILTLSPADDATNVAVSADLVATFSETVVRGSGNVLVKKTSDNSTAYTIDINSSSVTFSGASVTINPTTDLEPGVSYYVEIPSTAITDIMGNSFAGISGTTTWNFTSASTADTTPPTVVSLTPADNSSSGSTSADLVITFDENIVKGTGNILVRRTSDDVTVHTIDAASSAVTVTGSTATINPPADLQNLTGYYVQIAATAFSDASANFFAGIADKTTWNFTTVPDSTPPSVLSIDDGDADNLVTNGTLLNYTLTFSEDIDSTTVSAADFDNEGTSAVTIGTITETSPGVFSVQVTPTTGGTLKLRIPSSATIKDNAGNALVAPVSDNDTLTVSGDTTPPTVLSIIDDRSGAAVNANLPITYTITFDEDINVASVSAADFSNAGTATMQVGTITETTPGVFSVIVTPRSSGTLQLQIPNGADITDVAGNQLAPPVTDDTIITVNSVTTLTAGDIAFTGLQSDDPDIFSFVLLKDVVNGTQIVFTDNLWDGTALATNENTLTLTLNSSSSGFSAGTHFVNTNGGTAPAFRIAGTTTSAGLVTGSISGLSTSGDSILAYQGTAPTSGSSAAWIAGINTKAWYTAGTAPTGTNESRLPTALTLGTHAIQLSSTATEVDNGAYNRATYAGTARTIRLDVNNFANWTTNNSIGPVSTTVFTFEADQAPTNISLTSSTLPENSVSGTAIGTLSATDPNSNEAFIFSLPSGLGDNSDFSITGTTLQSSAVFDYETRSSCSVTIRVTDADGLTFDKQFTITITDVNEAPVITSGGTYSVVEANTNGLQHSQSSATPYLTSRNSDVQFTSLLTVGDAVGGNKLVGIPDGMGAFDNGDGTFTLLVNHEISNSLGVVRAHGQKGAFVSRLVINKSTLQIVSLQDFLPNSTSVYLSNNDPGTATPHSAWLAANTSIFSRFCSADLAAPSAWSWTDPGTGILWGTNARLFQNGEESGGSVTGVGPEVTTTFGRAFAFVATDDTNTTLNETGTAWELPHAGLFAWENSVANPFSQKKTILVGLDDSSPGGQIYVWVGDKQTTGNVVERAGLTRVSSSDSLYVIRVDGLAADGTGATPETAGTPINGTFSLVSEGDVSALTVAAHDSLSNTLGGTKFLRPEDGAWDPANNGDFYFVTTHQLDQVQDGIGTQVGRSRLYRLRFSDITNPTAGGSITCLLEGTEGQNMLDNISVSNGKVMLQEDVGNVAHLGKVWSYDIATDRLTEIAQHDRLRFGDIGVAATSPFSADEESSGVIDVSSILGTGSYLLNVQAHYATTSELVEGGQLLLMKTGVASGQSVVGTPTATDPDAGAVLTWDITGGADQAKFVIDATTGKLCFAVAPSFESPTDANGDNVYLVTIRVSDGTNTATQSVQVTVTAVNESPVNTTVSTVSVPENTTAVTTATGTDPEGTALTWAISGGADAVKFAINSTTGVLTFVSAPDFEAPTDNGADNSYFVTVTCSDGVNPPVNTTLVVTVTNQITESTGIDVQLGQTQRSYVRYLDLLFSSGSELAALISGNRFQLTKNDLNGLNPVNVPLTAGMFSTSGALARIDFGVNGLGGNRNTNGGDGYYEIAMDLDSNGTFETKKYFYRLLGDVNGDRRVDSTDAALIGSALGTANPERDTNGDGVVNATDRTLSIRAALRKLKDGLLTDD